MLIHKYLDFYLRKELNHFDILLPDYYVDLDTVCSEHLWLMS